MFLNRLLLFCILILIVGCRSDKSAVRELSQEDLIGSWIIFHATRNGNVTKSLENGNFVFQDDNSIKSNLFSTNNSLNFIFDRGTVSVEGDELVKSLEVISFNNDTLVLASKMKVFDMVFHLVRE